MPRFKFRNDLDDVDFSCDLTCARCIGLNKNGSRCKRRTCRYLPFCFTHLRRDAGLQVKPSTIAGAGDGLFTTVARKREEKIVEYTGEVLSGEEADARYGPQATMPYVLEPGQGQVIDAACRRGPGAYANHKTRSQANTRFSRSPDGSIWLRATKNIPANTELFVSYGDRFIMHQPGVTHRTTR